MSREKARPQKKKIQWPKTKPVTPMFPASPEETVTCPTCDGGNINMGKGGCPLCHGEKTIKARK